VLQHLNKNALASLFYETAIETEPRDPVSLYKYAYFCHEILQDMDAAEKYYELSNNVAPNMGNMIAFGKLMHQRGKNDKAKEILERATQHFPKSSVVHHQYAKFLSSIMHTDDNIAEEHYQIALKL